MLPTPMKATTGSDSVSFFAMDGSPVKIPRHPMGMTVLKR
jgi:hypothetical protein